MTEQEKKIFDHLNRWTNGYDPEQLLTYVRGCIKRGWDDERKALTHFYLNCEKVIREETKGKTAKTLEKLPSKVREELEILKDLFKESTTPEMREDNKAQFKGYIRALKDTDTITETERKLLFCWFTV